jgi:hypothetical protein
MPNVTAATTAHGRPGGIPCVPARSARRSVDVSITPAIVTAPPSSTIALGRSARIAIDSATPTSA